MRKAFLKTARESLLSMRRQVGADIENETKSSREGQKDEGMDAYDLASEERDRDISDRVTIRLGHYFLGNDPLVGEGGGGRRGGAGDLGCGIPTRTFTAARMPCTTNTAARAQRARTTPTLTDVNTLLTDSECASPARQTLRLRQLKAVCFPEMGSTKPQLRRCAPGKLRAAT